MRKRLRSSSPVKTMMLEMGETVSQRSREGSWI